MESFIYGGNEYNFIWFKDFKTDILPVVSEYKESGYINLHCAFDIETTWVNENFSTMYVWQFAVNDLTILGRTWKEFTQLLDTLSEYYKLNENNLKLRCWVQNLSYEWAFVRKWLKFKYDAKRKKYCVFATEQRKVIYFITDTNIEFRDSYILTARALSGYAKTYHLNHGKLSGKDFDYSKCRTKDTVLEPLEIAYCIEDVQTLAEWDKKYIVPEFLVHNSKIPLTSTGIVRAELERNFKAIPSKGKEKLKKRIADAFPTENQYKNMIQYLYRGGFVHSNSEYVDTDLVGGDMGSFDKKSSYPASALQNNFPWKFVKRYVQYFYDNVADNTGIHYNYKLWNDTSFIATITFKNIRRRTPHSIESKDKLIDYENATFDNGRLMSADSICVMLNEIDFKVYIMMYEWEEIACESLLVASKEPLPHYFLDMFLKYFYLKETIEDKQSTDYILSKYKLNSLYGMAVTSLYNMNIELDENSDLQQVEESRTYAELKKNKILLPAWGIWISSYSRESEVRLHYMTCIDDLGNVKKTNSQAIYGDTDSCKMFNVTGMSERIEQYNNTLRRKNKSMYTGEYPKEIYSELGLFQFEETYKKFKCLGAKRYLGTYIYKNKNTGKYSLKHSVTVAGLPKGALEKYASKNNKDIYSLFSFGLSVPKEYVNKKCIIYNDNYAEQTVIDYQGHTTHCFELSSCTLNDIAFEMKQNTEYQDIVKFAIELKERERRYGRN